ncbi:hypothetical protein LP52_03795 [Streptomonospora alba]|uniref:Uncharacterized protein n=1 Tax=Streptomonospora alba TaxID=183763 RepID=A0A0C2G9E1_9ACTN|nr:hypothetical protein [Streptomonospora alba]KII00064.1 hypothetical protein LP52_03795 [Streptomonospora alba]
MPPESTPAPAPEPAPQSPPDPAARRRGFRSGLLAWAAVCMIGGPTSCYAAVESEFDAAATGADSDPESFGALLTLGVLASVVLPIAMATVAAFRKDVKAAVLSAALLLWPLVAYALIVGAMAV